MEMEGFGEGEGMVARDGGDVHDRVWFNGLV